MPPSQGDRGRWRESERREKKKHTNASLLWIWRRRKVQKQRE